MSHGNLPFRILTPCVAAVWTVLLVACGGDGGSGGQPDRVVASVTITSPTLLPKEGDAVQFVSGSPIIPSCRN